MKTTLQVALYHAAKAASKLNIAIALKLLYLNVTGRSIHLRLPNSDIRLSLRGQSSDYHAFYTTFVRNDYPRIPHFSPRLILDLGANVGYSALNFAAQYPESTIVCIEPDTANFEVLCRSTSTFARIKCINAAVHSDAGLEGTLSGPNSLSMQLNVDRPINPGDQTTRTVSIDQLFSEWAAPNTPILVKMDIEGSEKAIFSKNLAWLPLVNYLFIEIHAGCWPTVVRALHPFISNCDITGENLCIELKPDAKISPPPNPPANPLSPI